jgi:hypothetical protein
MGNSYLSSENHSGKGGGKVRQGRVGNSSALLFEEEKNLPAISLQFLNIKKFSIFKISSVPTLSWKSLIRINNYSGI